jgi:sec-independent protein translocase protein TatB
MFDFGWGELVVIGVVALIVIGPKELPAVLRTIGQWTTKIRRMAGEFQSQFQEALREAEMADLKKEVDNLADTAKGFTSSMTSHFDPMDSTQWEPKPADGSANGGGESANKIENTETAGTPATEVPAPVNAVGTLEGEAPAASPVVEPAPAGPGHEVAPAQGTPGSEGGRPS